MSVAAENASPQVFAVGARRLATASELSSGGWEAVDSGEVFELVRDIGDPEHPLTLEQLAVVQEDLCWADDAAGRVRVQYTPTIPHCSMATLIGLAIRVRLLRSLPPRFKASVAITPGSHTSEEAINKQLADKERVAAALENHHLMDVINQCLSFHQRMG